MGLLKGRSNLMIGDSMDIEPESLRMMRNRVLIKYADQEMITKGGIILPEMSQRVVDSGKIISVGELTDGIASPEELQKGKWIRFNGVNVKDITLRKENYAIVDVTDIQGVFADEEA